MRDWPVTNNTDHANHAETDHNHQSDHLHTLFTRLHPQEVEGFYRSYQQWLLQQRIQAVQAQIAVLHLRISENTRELTAVEPSSTAQTVLARLYMHGVQNVDLLDRLLEHDDAWLDHTIELLELCEFLGFIQDNYTQWCEFALEGAYDWITSMDIIQQDKQSNQPDSKIPTPFVTLTNHISTESETLPQVTEEELLQKLMSEDDDATVKRPAIKLSELPAANGSTTVDTQPPAAQIMATSSAMAPSAPPPDSNTHPVTAITRPLPVLEKKSLQEQVPPNREGEGLISHPSPSSQSSSMVVTSPQRGPVWRLYNQLARRFFAT